MSRKSLFVTTYPENGWDCVGQVFTAPNEETVRSYLDAERGQDTTDEIIIHEAFEIIELD